MKTCLLILMVWVSACASAQVIPPAFLPVEEEVEPQPLLAQAIRVQEALTAIGSPLPDEAIAELHALAGMGYSQETVAAVQNLLDPFCLAGVSINPEARVKVVTGPAKPLLIQEGWRSFLVKIYNQGRVTSMLEVESPNAQAILHRSASDPVVKPENRLSKGELENRFFELLMFRDRPMKSHLSGLNLEYAIIQIYTRTQGPHEAKIGFHVGRGTEDLGFRNAIDILFDIKPSVKVVFNIRDDDGQPAMASLLIMDGIERIRISDGMTTNPSDYRLTMARKPDWLGHAFSNADIYAYDSVLPAEKRLRGIYPLPGRRSALTDEYPDFFFQPQVYRYDGEHVFLPPGEYTIAAGRGPEYLAQQMVVTVPEGTDTYTVEIRLKRWIHMAELGWYSGDHHIHAAGCSHYESPEEGVKPEHMWRQILGEDLNMGSNLTWGPCWYYQKTFFSGHSHPLSDRNNVLRYDVEVSGFPSSHAGHLVLLNLKEDDYPGTKKIEDWPSWTLPVLQWARAQGGIVGYAHSGWGLAPVKPTRELPNYELPKMDGIGANEYIVTVTHRVIDFYSLGDTPSIDELNMLYHTLNSGFRTRISGETDFPCISDEVVGKARVYARLENGLTFDAFMAAIREGRSYVSDGFTHLIDFKVNGAELGLNGSELNVKPGTTLQISVKAAAYLNDQQDAIGSIIASKPYFEQPYWHVERARIGKSRKVAVSLIVNGKVVDKKEIIADGQWNDLTWNHRIEKSSWVAIRVFPSAHTNPFFVTVNNRPVLEESSIKWCLDAVDKCWKEKRKQIRNSELTEAEIAYNQARTTYRNLLMQLKK